MILHFAVMFLMLLTHVWDADAICIRQSPKVKDLPCNMV